MELNGRCGFQGHPLLRFGPHKSIPYGVLIVTVRQWTSNSLGRLRMWAVRKWAFKKKRKGKKVTQAEARKALK